MRISLSLSILALSSATTDDSWTRLIAKTDTLVSKKGSNAIQQTNWLRAEGSRAEKSTITKFTYQWEPNSDAVTCPASQADNSGHRGPRPDHREDPTTAPTTIGAHDDKLETGGGFEGECCNHWELCPNMCQFNETLWLDENQQYSFAHIRGNIMTEYTEIYDWTKEYQREIVLDFKGKSAEIDEKGQKSQLDQEELTKRENIHLSQINSELERLEDLLDQVDNLLSDTHALSHKFDQLEEKSSKYYQRCFEIAPCNAVYDCLGKVEAGTTCDAIAAGIAAESSSEYTEYTGVYLLTHGSKTQGVHCNFDHCQVGSTCQAVFQLAHLNSTWANGIEMGKDARDWEHSTCESNYGLDAEFISTNGQYTLYFKNKDSQQVTEYATGVSFSNGKVKTSSVRSIKGKSIANLYNQVQAGDYLECVPAGVNFGMDVDPTETTYGTATDSYYNSDEYSYRADSN